MKYKRLLPLLIAAVGLPSVMTGCVDSANAAATEEAEGILPGGCVVEPTTEDPWLKYFRQPGTGEAEVLSDKENILEVPDYKLSGGYLTANALDIFKSYYEAQEDKSQNVLISPTSLQSALALLIDSSSNNPAIKEELAKFFDAPIEEIEPALQNLLAVQFKYEDPKKYENMSEIIDGMIYDFFGQEYKKDFDPHKNVYLMSNSLWVSGVEDKSTIRENYLASIRDKYNAMPFVTDLTTDVGIKAVNSWVADKTFGLISQVLSQPTEAKAVIINTSYFDCAWAKQFEHEDTIPDYDFHLSNGDTVKVDMMCSDENADYIATEFSEGVRISYKPTATIHKEEEEEDINRFSFIALLPKEKYTLDDVINEINSPVLYTISKRQYDYDVSVKLPRFTFEDTLNLRNLANKMGITTAFDEDKAKLDILKDRELYISDIIQKVKIDVAESGTEAAAATSIVMVENAVAMPDVTEVKSIVFDQPFVYMVVDNINETPVFVGVMNNPAS